MFEFRAPKVKVSQLRLLVYGDPKVGKSALFSDQPGIVYLDFDGGLGHLKVQSSPVITSWTQVEEAYKWLKAEVLDGTGPQTVVLDTVDLAWELVCEYQANKLGVSHLGALKDHGKGWYEARKKLKNFLDALVDLGLGVYLISHTRTEEIDTPRGVPIVRTIAGLSGAASREFVGWVDAILYLDIVPTGETRAAKNAPVKFEGVQRVVYTHPGPYHLAGGRFVEALPEVVDLAPPPEGWNRIRALLERGFNRPEEKEFVKASEPQEQPEELVN